jgi:predicted TIM-barrel fold metal-dependent hydrolase
VEGTGEVSTERYTVISADGHAGASVPAYRDYLESRWHDEFDAWARTYTNPFEDLAGSNAYRNWDSDARVSELESDGIVAEVLFPNTIPPFFPSGALVTPAPTAAEYAHRWAGLQAHNRWLADFCAEAPGRRAGIAQILLNDVDDALAAVRFAKEAGLTGGVLLPGVPPNHEIPPLWSDVYEPLWTACEELDVVVNHHSGGGLPTFDLADPAARAVMLVEIPIYAHRALWALIFAGVFERHPRLKFVLTEQGTSWVPGTLANLDWFTKRMRIPTAAEYHFGGAAVEQLSLTPSEYFRRNCWVGASFIRPVESALRHDVGVDRIMWGSDYPHSEGSYPYSREALRASFADADEAEVRTMCATNAAEVYGFDLDRLDAIAVGVGPTVAEIAEPLAAFPADSTCNAFDPDAIVRTW